MTVRRAKVRGENNETFYIHAGLPRKQRLLRAVKILKRHRSVVRSQTDFIITAVDEKLDRLAKKHPEIDEVV